LKEHEKKENIWVVNKELINIYKDVPLIEHVKCSFNTNKKMVEDLLNFNKNGFEKAIEMLGDNKKLNNILSLTDSAKQLNIEESYSSIYEKEFFEIGKDYIYFKGHYSLEKIINEVDINKKITNNSFRKKYTIYSILMYIINGAHAEYSMSNLGTLFSDKEVNPTNTAIKIKWNGTKVQLYDIFRQLKNINSNKGSQPLIANSYTDIAQFLINNFEGFHDSNLRTIIDELERNERPKKNPIDIQL